MPNMHSITGHCCSLQEVRKLISVMYAQKVQAGRCNCQLPKTLPRWFLIIHAYGAIFSMCRSSSITCCLSYLTLQIRHGSYVCQRPHSNLVLLESAQNRKQHTTCRHGTAQHIQGVRSTAHAGSAQRSIAYTDIANCISVRSTVSNRC